MPFHLFEGLEIDVTVISIKETTAEGEPVMLKILSEDVEFMDEVKKATLLPSGFPVISIFTPPGGIADLIITLKGNSGPGEGGSKWPSARGCVSTTRSSCEGMFFFLQLPAVIRANIHPNIKMNLKVFIQLTTYL